MMKASWKASWIWRRLTTRCRGAATWPPPPTAPTSPCLRWASPDRFGWAVSPCLVSQRCSVRVAGWLGLAEEMPRWSGIMCQRQHWKCFRQGKQDEKSRQNIVIHKILAITYKSSITQVKASGFNVDGRCDTLHLHRLGCLINVCSCFHHLSSEIWGTRTSICCWGCSATLASSAWWRSTAAGAAWKICSTTRTCDSTGCSSRPCWWIWFG